MLPGPAWIGTRGSYYTKGEIVTFAVIQYPFIDTRLLNVSNPSGYFFPQQFRRQTTRNRYFRFLGPEKLRRYAEDFPNGEQTYFDSKAAVTFCPVTPLKKGVFKRLYADDLSLHYDIGLYGPHFGKYNRLIRRLMETPRLKVTSRFEPRECVFSPYTFFDKLLQIYQYATTSKKVADVPPAPIQAGIIPGTPAIILSYRSPELKLPSPSQIKWLELFPGLRAGCSLFDLNNHPIAVYLIEHDHFASKSDEVRRLRVCISKIHAYKETLRLLLEFIKHEQFGGIKLEPSSFYLKKLLELAKKEWYYGFDNQDFWGLAYSIDKEFHQAQWTELVDQAKVIADCLDQEMRKGVKTLNKFTYENSGVMFVNSKDVDIGSITIGKTQKELDGAVQDFFEEAERLLAKLEANGKEVSELKEQIKVFCDSAKEKSPKKDVCNVLFKGIKAALATAPSVEALFNLGQKIVELL